MSKPIERCDKLKLVVLASILKIPPDLLLDCRCAYYGIYGAHMISWGAKWDHEMLKYTSILKQSPYFIRQMRDHISTDTIFKLVDNP